MNGERRNNTLVIIILVCILLGAGVIWGGWIWYQQSQKETFPLINESNTTHDVSVVYINAGRADSMLVQVDGYSYLIDTGLKSSVDTIDEVLTKYNVDTLDAVFLTHTHKDHINGLKKIADKYDISMLYSAEISMDKSDGTNAIENKAEKIGVSLNKLTLGDTVQLADDVYFEVLGPIEYNDDDDNDNSLVLRMYVNGRTFLFAGDMQFAEEKTILDYGIDVSADIYKVGNHGNPDATSEQFAKAVSPELAIITTDTSEDDDSANANVISYFGDAEVLVTQDYELGILVKVDENGEIQVSEA